MEDDEKAGGTATVDAPKAGADKPLPGIMDSILIHEPETALEPETETEPEETEETEEKGEASAEIEEGEIPEPEKTEEGKPVQAEAEKEPFYGRFKTAEDLKQAYEASSTESRRLHSANLSLQKENNELEDKLAQIELEAEVGNFRELSEDDLVKLMESEDPKDRLRAQRYITEERAHQDRKRQLEKERARAQRESKEKEIQIKSQIEREFDYMKKTPQKYPQFNELVPLMSEIFDKMGGILGGHVLASEFLYYAAYGIAAKQQTDKANQSSLEDKNKAKAQALLKAKAAGLSGGTHVGKTPASNSDEVDDDEFVNRMVSSRPKNFI